MDYRASVPQADLNHVLAHTGAIWRELAGKRLFVTGGTGFFGIWLLESIAAANDALKVGIGVTALSRDPAQFLTRMPHLARRDDIDFCAGECADFSFPPGAFSHVIHLATPSAAELGANDPGFAVRTLAGTSRVLEFARASGARRLLFASSGAVYGIQPADLPRMPERHHGAPELKERGSAYGEIKRLSELMCTMVPEVDCVIARGFAFAGPHLPLNERFAIGSFIRAALAGEAIRLRGDGTTRRSYLHAADLAIWLLTLLVRGRPAEAYNVGSDHAICLADLAGMVSAAFGGVAVEMATSPEPGQGAAQYVPDIDKARSELGLEVLIPLAETVARTVAWAQQASGQNPRPEHSTIQAAARADTRKT